jgi:hypothetical protein
VREEGDRFVLVREAFDPTVLAALATLPLAETSL